MIFENTFENLSDEQISMLDEYFDTIDYNSAGHTFSSCYMWRNTHNLTWQIVDGYLLISSGTGDEDEEGNKIGYMSSPLTKTGSYDVQSLRSAILKAKAMFEAKGFKMSMSLIPAAIIEPVKEAVGDIFDFDHDRDDDEYVYLREELATLSGRKLHNKKNHLNQFLKTYEYTYEEINADNLPEVEDFILAKNDYILQDMPKKYRMMLEMEGEAIAELLKFVGTGRILTGIIRVDGKIVAATIGEYASTKKRDGVIVHVEKADDRLKGLYQAINWEFVRHLPEEVIYVNREEDMGLPTLRQTKEGYKPHHMGEKYIGKLKK